MSKSPLLALSAALLALGVHAQEAVPAPALPAFDDFTEIAADDSADAPAAAPSEAAPADAGEARPAKSPYPRFGLHLGSHHWPERKNWWSRKYNNLNPGVYVRFDNGVTGGFYHNSLRRTSLYAGWTWAHSACGPALTIGAITGYRKGPIAMAIPSMCVLEHVRLSFIPRVEPKGATVLHLSLEL